MITLSDNVATSTVRAGRLSRGQASALVFHALQGTSFGSGRRDVAQELVDVALKQKDTGDWSVPKLATAFRGMGIKEPDKTAKIVGDVVFNNEVLGAGGDKNRMKQPRPAKDASARAQSLKIETDPEKIKRLIKVMLGRGPNSGWYNDTVNGKEVFVPFVGNRVVTRADWDKLRTAGASISAATDVFLVTWRDEGRGAGGGTNTRIMRTLKKWGRATRLKGPSDQRRVKFTPRFSIGASGIQKIVKENGGKGVGVSRAPANLSISAAEGGYYIIVAPGLFLKDTSGGFTRDFNRKMIFQTKEEAEEAKAPGWKVVSASISAASIRAAGMTFGFPNAGKAKTFVKNLGLRGFRRGVSQNGDRVTIEQNLDKVLQFRAIAKKLGGGLITKVPGVDASVRASRFSPQDIVRIVQRSDSDNRAMFRLKNGTVVEPAPQFKVGDNQFLGNTEDGSTVRFKAEDVVKHWSASLTIRCARIVKYKFEDEDDSVSFADAVEEEGPSIGVDLSRISRDGKTIEVDVGSQKAEVDKLARQLGGRPVSASISAADPLKKMINALPSGKSGRGKKWGWRKRGGFAGQKAIARSIGKFKQLGFKPSDFKSRSSPDGSSVGSSETLKHKDGHTVTYHETFGVTRADNSFSMELTLTAEPGSEPRGRTPRATSSRPVDGFTARFKKVKQLLRGVKGVKVKKEGTLVVAVFETPKGETRIKMKDRETSNQFASRIVTRANTARERLARRSSVANMAQMKRDAIKVLKRSKGPIFPRKLVKEGVTDELKTARLVLQKLFEERKVDRDGKKYFLKDSKPARQRTERITKKQSRGTQMKRVKSISELHRLALRDPRYEALAKAAAENLGMPAGSLDKAIQGLSDTAMETTEKGVVGEINFVLKLLKDEV